MLTAILLAAGSSKRLGTPKQLLPLGSYNVLECTLQNLLNTSIDQIYIILGYQAKIIKSSLSNYLTHPKLTCLINPNYEQGMGNSLAFGVQNLPSEVNTILIMLGDRPLVSSTLIDTIITNHLSHNNITCPIYKKQRGHPVIFDSKFREDLIYLNDDIGARSILKKYSSYLTELPVNDISIIQGINTIDDYELVKKLYNST